MSYPDRPIVNVVSGVPRSGTSMMMRMLEAGGMPLLTDAQRAADEDNPRGYYEFDRAKRLRQDQAWLPEAVGKAVKVISFLLPALPDAYHYRVLFMLRPIEEVLASQRAMLQRQGAPADVPEGELRQAFEKHLQHIRPWLQAQPNVEVLELDYHAVLHTPRASAEAVAYFLRTPMNIEAMAAVVENALWRQRG